ncbi:MAG: DHA2 family efflux MFS transporter permease subunit [Eggerthellaceae bacterium]|nr:DHA2 family efflux MFS transporter permease subunit [Eggerthellaceae bacterium]
MALSERGRVYVLFAIVVLATALGSLTQTVMNSMLVGIEADFGTPASVGQWLTTIYMLVLGITVPVVTFLSQRLSMRNVVLLSLGLFLVGGVVDLAAPNFGVLVVGRVLQAVAAGITLPVLQSIAMVRFPQGQNGTAMGIAGIAMGFAPNIGPLIGGVLVDSWGWRSFFALLIAVVVLLAAATLAFVPREEAPSRDAKLETVSFLLSTLGFGGLLLGFSNAASMSLTSPLVWVPVIVGVVCLVLFVRRQRQLEAQGKRPLISMRIFGSAHYRISFVAQNCLFASFMGITLIVPLYVQGLCGGSAFEAGVVFIPATIFAVLVNPLAGILSDKLGARPVVVCAAVLLTAGAVSMAFMDEATPLWLVTLMQTVRGMGVSALIGPLNSWGMVGLPRDVMMDGSAFFAAVRQSCASLGTALMVLIISALAAVVPAALAYQLAFGLSAALAAAVLVVAVAKVK